MKSLKLLWMVGIGLWVEGNSPPSLSRITRCLWPSATFTIAWVSRIFFRRSRSAAIWSSSCFSTSRLEGWKCWISKRVHSTPHFYTRTLMMYVRKEDTSTDLDTYSNDIVQLFVYCVTVSYYFVILSNPFS